MNLDERIGKIEGILSGFSSGDINKIYKENEIELQKEYFMKYPDVKYSEGMKKKMIKEAKRKSISKGRLKLIENLNLKINSFFEELNYYNFEEEFLKIIQSINDRVHTKQEINSIFIEHDFDPKYQFVRVYKDENLTDELIVITSKFNFDPIWGFTTKSKFSNFEEALEGIIIEDEEFVLLYNEIFKLYSYRILERLIKSSNIENVIKNEINTGVAIFIGEHDNWKYKVR